MHDFSNRLTNVISKTAITSLVVPEQSQSELEKLSGADLLVKNPGTNSSVTRNFPPLLNAPRNKHSVALILEIAAASKETAGPVYQTLWNYP